MCLHSFLGHAARRKTRLHRARIAQRAQYVLQKSSQPQRDQQFGKKGPQKAAVTTKAEGCLTSSSGARSEAAMQHPLPPQPPGPDRVAILKFDDRNRYGTDGVP